MHERVLVTGGAGFVGSSLAIALKRRGSNLRVMAFDNLRRRGSELNLPRLRDAGVEFIHGDVRSFADLEALSPAPDLILECSAEPSAQAGYDGSPEYLVNTQLIGCFHCLELARRVKADFLFISTSRVYPYGLLNGLSFFEGEKRFHLLPEQDIRGASEFGISESFPLDGPRSLYGMTKLAAELMVQEYGDAYGLRYIINRCGVITGPWQMARTDQGVIAHWLVSHFFRRPLRYIGFQGTGKQVRDFLHIDDLCELIEVQIDDFARFQGSLFNVGGGVECSLSLLECTDLCREITGNSLPIGSEPGNRPADVRIFLTDRRRLSQWSGWQPRRDARRTLGETFDWLRTNEADLKGSLLSHL